MTRIPIITFHSIDESGSRVSSSVESFERTIAFLSQQRFQPLTLGSAIDVLKRRQSDTSKHVVITFDDGYRNNLSLALPILQKYDFTATVFVTTAYLGQHNSWPDQHPSIPQLKMLSRAELRELFKAGIEIGAHTHTHPKLTRLKQEQAFTEMNRSKDELEALLGTRVDLFCYPFGLFNESVQTAAKQLFSAAISTKPGQLSEQSNLFAIERINACSPLFVHMPKRMACVRQFSGYISLKRAADALSFRGSRERA